MHAWGGKGVARDMHVQKSIRRVEQNPCSIQQDLTEQKACPLSKIQLNGINAPCYLHPEEDLPTTPAPDLVSHDASLWCGER
eukprot:scaffold83898_cov18-Tisochrysis_lutea.AAC.1